jgi:hypothetical protein
MSMSSLSSHSTGAAAAPAADLLTVKEMGAGGDEVGVDPLITPIPRSLQSDPSEPASSEMRTPGRLGFRLQRFS